MNVAAPPQAMPVATAVPVSATTSTVRHQLRIRFYRRMKVQRVYRMVVELRAADGKSATGASAADVVLVRPLIPGALVQPGEQEISPRASNNTITFSVTPLARGRLKDARVQLLHKGRLLEEVKTPMTGTSQQRTWVLALMSLLALAYFMKMIGPLPNFATGDLAEAGGQSLDSLLVTNVPDYNAYVPEGWQEYLTREAVAVHAQDAYNRLYAIPYLSFYITAVLLSLTLIGAVRNRASWLRRSRKGKSLILPSVPAATSTNPLHFAHH